MIAAVIGALLGAVGLVSLIDSIAGTNVTAWFFEKVTTVVMFFLQPLFDLLCFLLDSVVDVVKSFILK